MNVTLAIHGQTLLESVHCFLLLCVSPSSNASQSLVIFSRQINQTACNANKKTSPNSPADKLSVQCQLPSQQCSAMLSDAQWCSAMLLLISAQTSLVAQSRLCIERSSIVNLFSTGAVNFTENGWRSHVYLMAEHPLLLVVRSSRKWLARLRGVPPYNSAAYIPIMRMVYIKRSLEGNHTAMLKSRIWENFSSNGKNPKD